jgi:phosphatidylserine/phosphatidylglycerophosphate/cardiolipin synthase-like enzyme
MSVEDFFLDGDEENDDVQFRMPADFKSSSVTPLIDGRAAFMEMERSILRAQKYVFLSLWMFNTKMPLLLSEAKKMGSTWLDLIKHTTDRGVLVYILISDFDPVMKDDYHKMAWKAYYELSNSRSTGHLQFMCSMNEIVASATFARSQHTKKLDDILTSLKTLKKPTDGLVFLPGLWANLTFNKIKQLENPTGKEFTEIAIASHHQKTCIIDNEVGFLGGLDLQTGRIDDQTHAETDPKKRPNLWHDVNCKVTGRVVHFLTKNFIGRWNYELPLADKFYEQCNNNDLGMSLPRKHFFKIDSAAKLFEYKDKKSSAQSICLTPPVVKAAQILRTIARNEKSESFSYKTIRKDIYEAYRNAIKKAENFIYIENQYFRSKELTDDLIQAWYSKKEEKKDLQIIIVVPVAPEEVSGATIDEPTNHGIYLQNENFKRLRKQISPESIGIFSMIEPARTDKKSDTVYRGSFQIYLHSKIMIVDDQFAIIGSANTSKRSFLLDTEIAVAWYDKEIVKQFRIDLFEEQLGKTHNVPVKDWKPADFMSRWNLVAHSNSQVSGKFRKGFIIRHNEAPSQRLRGEEFNMASIIGAMVKAGEITVWQGRVLLLNTRIDFDVLA